ncbi:hypothetical protein J4402_05190 [Candidatus Pacearchaeota archaeon]|nr:hypothetical protein [Candidatus Pacearchaeota archaeon]
MAKKYCDQLDKETIAKLERVMDVVCINTYFRDRYFKGTTIYLGKMKASVSLSDSDSLEFVVKGTRVRVSCEEETVDIYKNDLLLKDQKVLAQACRITDQIVSKLYSDVVEAPVRGALSDLGAKASQ